MLKILLWIQLSTSVFSFKIFFTSLCVLTCKQVDSLLGTHKKEVVILRKCSFFCAQKEIVVILPFMSFMWPFFVKSNKFYRKKNFRREKNLQTMAHIFFLSYKEKKKYQKFNNRIPFPCCSWANIFRNFFHKFNQKMLGNYAIMKGYCWERIFCIILYFGCYSCIQFLMFFSKESWLFITFICSLCSPWHN